MFLHKKFLEQYETRNRISLRDSSRVLFESIQDNDMYDIFISYSSKDILYAKKAAEFLRDNGFSVYIDDEDSVLDKKNVNSKTTVRLARILENCRCLIFLFTENSSASSWCPWEIGYMSAYNDFKCVTLPIVDEPFLNYIEHKEYLLNYPQLQFTKNIDGNYHFMLKSASKQKWITLIDYILD